MMEQTEQNWQRFWHTGDPLAYMQYRQSVRGEQTEERDCSTNSLPS